MTWKIDSEARLRCSKCNHEVDPDVCWCGDMMNDHLGSGNHDGVMMGCMCKMTPDPRANMAEYLMEGQQKCEDCGK